MKTKEELEALKKEVETLNKKLTELSDDELKEVTGGLHDLPKPKPDEKYVLSSNPGTNAVFPIIFAGTNDQGGMQAKIDNIIKIDDDGFSQK